MIPVAFHRLAAREFRESIRWYRERSLVASVRFKTAVDMAVDRIARDPLSLPIERQHFRWARVKRFPYRVIFERQGPDRIWSSQ
jgi:hypothetical protein